MLSIIQRGKQIMRFFLDSDGYFVNMVRDLKRTLAMDTDSILERYGAKGCEILSNATPIETGLAASSWRYEIVRNGPDSTTIEWHNDDIEHGYNVVVLLQYGHGLKGGGYVQGNDFINPAVKGVFDEMVVDLWKEVCG